MKCLFSSCCKAFWKQWKEQCSSNKVLWVASPCVLTSLNTWSPVPGQGSSPDSPGWTVLHNYLSYLPSSLTRKRHCLPRRLLSNFFCRAFSRAYLTPQDWETVICWGNISSLWSFVSKRYHMNSVLWGISTAPLYRFLYWCLTTSHLLLSILLPIQELRHRAWLHHCHRSLGEKARLNSLSSSLLPHAHDWQGSVHQGISAPGNYCLWATPLSQSQGFGLVNCVSWQMYSFPKLYFFSSRGFYAFPDVSLWVLMDDVAKS